MILTGIAVAVEVARRSDPKLCLLGGTSEAMVEGPKSGKRRAGAVRPRPCKKGKGTTTYTERRRLVGAFVADPERLSRQAPGADITDEEEFVNWRAARYGAQPNWNGRRVVLQVVPVTNEADRIRRQRNGEGGYEAWQEPAADFYGMNKTCWYAVYEIGRRRHCTCPDGKPCKRRLVEGDLGWISQERRILNKIERNEKKLKDQEKKVERDFKKLDEMKARRARDSVGSPSVD